MLITNAVICDVNGERREDVLIEEGKVVAIGSGLKSDEVIDAEGAYLLPGLVDTNVRLKDAQLNASTLEKVAKEAQQGGVTRLVLAPDCTPSINDSIVLEFVQAHQKREGRVDLMSTIATVDENERLSNIAILLKNGAMAPYMTTAVSNNTACRIAEYVKMHKTTLFCKAQDTSLSSVGVMVEGAVATKLGLVGIPPFGEVVHVARMIEIARNFEISIVFKSIASPRSIALISKAKEEGVNVSCEVSLHHLMHCDEACMDFNTTAKLNPPLVQKEAMLALQEALKAGKIESLTLLHQPNSPVNKEVAFAEAAYGCEALADAYSLYYTKLVKSGLIDLQELIRLAVQNPAKSIGQEAGEIRVGQKADLVLFDPKVSFTVENSHSLYHDETLFGAISPLKV
ncbi:amidohydrolase family protein [Sulfurimonas sp. HSL3-7]|uniref:amidohydrolase family protein n=1 Tax=Sulfonitrofixus jiaomeiensis TaxID=3131938 RepID=UPI0031F8F639